MPSRITCFPCYKCSRWLRGLLLISSLAGLVGVASATTVEAPDFSGLVNQSDYIVRAVVKKVDSRLEQTTRGRKIYTDVTVEVLEVIAGKPPQPLVLTMLGGKVGAEEMVLEGAPQFHVGDEDILFVQGNGQQMFPLVAIMHGRYPIQRDTGTGREFVARSNKVPLQNTAEVALPMAEGSAAQVQIQVKSSAQALTPADFVQKIKAAVKSSNARLNER